MRKTLCNCYWFDLIWNQEEKTGEKIFSVLETKDQLKNTLKSPENSDCITKKNFIQSFFPILYLPPSPTFNNITQLSKELSLL